MILRVYAMWNQSRGILYFLLFIYVPQVIISFVFQGVYVNPNTYFSGMSQAKLQAKMGSHTLLLVPAIVVQIADVSSCNMFFNDFPSHLLWGITALRLVLGVTLLILALISTLRQSLVMYNATKQWQPNRYSRHPHNASRWDQGGPYALRQICKVIFLPTVTPPCDNQMGMENDSL